MKKQKRSTGFSTHLITGPFHGAYVYANSEGEARQIFHKFYNGECIIHHKVRKVYIF